MSKYALLVLLVLVAVSLVAEAHRVRRPQRQNHRGRVGNPGLAWQVRQFMRSFRFNLGVDKPGFQLSLNVGGNNQNWWDGPNVCETNTSDEPRERDDEISLGGENEHHTFSVSESCDVTETVYKCVNTKIMGGVKTITTMAKKCCKGYTRKSTDHGCPKEIHLQNLNNTANSLGLQKFLETSHSVDLTDDLVTGNFTVFAPTNEAFTEFGQDMGPILIVTDSMIEQLTEKVTRVMFGHLSNDVITTSSMHDEQLIDTLSPLNSKIRINFYDGTDSKIMLANCQRVTSADNMATNGVIHVVDQVLSPVTKSITEIISKDPNLTYLKTALGRTALSSTLREDGHFTLYAPTDAAFRQLEEGVLNRLFNQTTCLKEVLQNHILPNVICSAAVQGPSRTRNVLDTYLYLTRDEDEKLFVQDHQVVATDIMATNGVIHLIDQVLFMDRAMGVLDIVNNQVPELLNMVRRAGLENDLLNANGVTFFAPTSEALSKLNPDILDALMNDTSALRNLLTYHVTSGVNPAKLLFNNQRLSTLNEGKEIRINKYSEMRHESPGYAQCVPIVSSSARICNGVVHFVNQVLIPPRGSIMYTLRQEPRFSKFVDLIRLTNLERRLDEDDPLTVLALTNEAFTNLPEDIQHVLRRNNTRKIEKLIFANVIPRTVCCKAIQNWFMSGIPYLRSINGKLLTVTSMFGSTSVGHATVTECDLTATNGVIQVVDGFSTRLERRRSFWWGFK